MIAATEQDYELWVLLHQACDAMARARDNELRPAGISGMQAEVLFIVKTLDHMPTPAEISRCLFREPHTVSGLLNRMERQGLVTKLKDLERKNVIRVTITPKGEEAYRQSREMKVIHKLLSCLSQEQQANLRVCLGTLRHNALVELAQQRPLPFA